MSKAADKKPEMVTIPKAQLDEILENQRKLIAAMGEPSIKPKETKNRKATIFFIEGEPVVGYVNKGTEERPKYIYEKPDPENKSLFLAYVDVITRAHEHDDKKEPYRFNFTEFLQECERQECDIVSVEEKEWKIDQGTTLGRTFQEGTYYMIEGAVVPVEVTGRTRFFKMKLPDESEIVIHEQYVNISK